MTNQDLKQVKKISHVVAADLYGYANIFRDGGWWQG
jgi:hypothetical protein